ncbi:MAG: protein kinase [Candidatus Schekmanbacteria bacterium]|nr:protein kinase [Candidatus Schekmanbacteria bacterium]
MAHNDNDFDASSLNPSAMTAGGQHGGTAAVLLPLPGQLFDGRYEIHSLLGRGGMGSVYRVWDRDGGVELALKVLHVLGTDLETLSRRFRREFRAVAKLQHRNIVSVRDMGSAGGMPYFTMEIVDGMDLRRHVAAALTADESANAVAALNHPQRLNILIDTLMQVCAALDYIHVRRFVHRDLKPTNIVVTVGGCVKLMDFGLVREDGQAESIALTKSGIVVGTAAYMSPEQASGERIDARADLYSLGVILYELLAGRLPFQGPSAVSVLFKQVTEEPPPIRGFNPGVVGDLEDIAYRLLRKDPAERFRSAELVSRALSAAGAKIARRANEATEAFAAVVAEVPGGITGARGGSRGAAPESSSDAMTKAVERQRPSTTKETAPIWHELFDPRLIGRAKELEQLADLLNRTLEGNGDVAFLLGESGIGKSRLADEVARRAKAKGFRVLKSRCFEGTRIPGNAFVPLLERIERHLRTRPDDAGASLLRQEGLALAELVPAFRELPSLRRLPPPERLGPEQEKYRLLTAVTGMLRNLSTRRPLLLILDDLQWADELSLDLLGHLARNLVFAAREIGDARAQRPVLVLVTGRDDEIRRPPNEDVGRRIDRLRASGLAKVLSIGRLSVEDVAQVVQSMLGAEDAPPLFAKRIYIETEGNPFFVEEMVRGLVEDGVLRREGDQWVVLLDSQATLVRSAMHIGEYAQLRVPPSIREALRRRLERLSEEDLSLLRSAAVLGREFDFELLWGVLGGEEDALLDQLDRLVREGVLVEKQEEVFDFYHDKIREVLYDELRVRKRRRLHVQAAELLERRGARAREDFAEMLAFHYTRGDVPEKAIPYLIAAGDRFRGRFANAEALANYDQALAFLGSLSREQSAETELLQCRALAGKGLVLDTLGRYGEAREAFDKVIAALPGEAGEQASLVAQALLGLAKIEVIQANLDVAEQLSTRALAIGRRLADMYVTASALLRLGIVSWRRGDLQAGLSFNQEALAVAEAGGDTSRKLAALMNLEGIELALGNRGEAMALGEQHVAQQRQLGAQPGLVVALNNHAVHLIRAARFEEAAACFAEAQDAAKRIGDRRSEALAIHGLGSALEGQGDLRQALLSYEQAGTLLDEVGDEVTSLTTLAVKAGVIRELGDAARAEELAWGILARVTRLRQPRLVAEAKIMIASCRIAAGDTTAAEKLAVEVLGELEPAGPWATRASAYLVLQEVAFRSRRYEESLALAREVEPVADEQPLLGLATHAMSAQARLTLHDLPAAVAHAQAIQRLITRVLRNARPDLRARFVRLPLVYRATDSALQIYRASDQRDAARELGDLLGPEV